MKQTTWDRFNIDTCKLESVTVIDTVCPCCQKPIRFVDPNNGLHSFEDEAEHYRGECERLYREIFELKETIRVLGAKL